MRLFGCTVAMAMFAIGCSGPAAPGEIGQAPVIYQPSASDLARLKLRYQDGLRDALGVPAGMTFGAPKVHAAPGRDLTPAPTPAAIPTQVKALRHPIGGGR